MVIEKPRLSRKGIMHRFMAGVTILEHELSELRLLVERQTGILLDCPNSALAAHVADYLEPANWTRLPRCLTFAIRDHGSIGMRDFLDGVLNANTGFFRHPGAMNALARHVIPQLYSRKPTTDRHASHLERGLWHRRRSVLHRHGPLRGASQ